MRMRCSAPRPANQKTPPPSATTNAQNAKNCTRNEIDELSVIGPPELK